MKLSNLEMTEKSINVQENDKDVQENDMLHGSPPSQPYQRLHLHSLRSADTNNAPSNLCGGERSKGWFPYDRGSPITDRRSHKVCDAAIIWKLLRRLRSCDRDRRRSQKINHVLSPAIVCDQLPAICDRLRSYGNQPLDRTSLLRSSAITIAGSQTIAEVVSI